MARQTALTDADFAAVKEEMRALMIEQARARTTITYSELSARLQTARIHYHSFLMTRLLIEIGREEIAAGRGVLPAVVVTKATGMPGGGYFGPRLQVDGITEELEAEWLKDLDELYNYWAEHPADDEAGTEKSDP